MSINVIFLKDCFILENAKNIFKKCISLIIIKILNVNAPYFREATNEKIIFQRD